MTAELAHIPYWNPVLQADYCHACGDNWPCLHYRQNQPPHCLCSHARTIHRYDAGNCWIAACGCSTYRPDERPAK